MAELPPPYVTNERWKSVSRSVTQLGTALLAAAAVKGYTSGGLSIETLEWFVMSAILMWTGWVILSLLEAEK